MSNTIIKQFEQLAAKAEETLRQRAAEEMTATFRLADSLPHELLEDWPRAHPPLKLRRPSP